MGCQYLNPHNVQILKFFNFNTNVRIGDVLQVFYSTLYKSKSTQKEDSEIQLRILCAVVRLKDYLIKMWMNATKLHWSLALQRVK
jgi:hypothetical protein